MRRSETFGYQRALSAFIAILIVFFGIVIAVIVAHEKEMHGEAHKNTARELELIGHFTRDAILRNDFAAIEEFIRQWGVTHPEIIGLKATTPNGFVLADFKKRGQPGHPVTFRSTVEYNRQELLTLEMVEDFASFDESLERFIAQLTGGAIFLIVLLGGALWFALQRYGFKPLEKEVASRREAELKFRKLLESAPDAMVYVDRQGRVALMNAQTEKLFGYAPGELLGREIETLMPERFREKHRIQRADYVLSPQTRPIRAGLDLFGLTKHGREFPVDISLSPIETSEGLFVLADIRDVSERKRTEEVIKRGYYYQTTINSILRIAHEHRALEEQMEGILDTILRLPFLAPLAMGCIFLVEENPEILVMKVQRGLPLTIRTECARVTFGECLCGMAATERDVVFADCTARVKDIDKASPHGHYCVPIMSGETVLGAMNLYVEKDHRRSREEEEILAAVMKTLAGIIERSMAEQERERLRERLSQAEKLTALGRLTANVAHEVRNPLTVLGGFARRLEKKLSPESKERKYVGIINSEVARLERILRNVLTFSREAGLQPRPEEINAIIEESLAPFELLCKERSIRIKRSLGDLPPVMADRDRMREVLHNLLANAVDAMPQGGVLTVASRKEKVHESPLLVVRITDTGAGIPEDKLRKIFEPFFTTKTLIHGTGLGLAISKKIVEDHGGDMGVESTVGKGSTFIFSLPLE